MSRAQKIIAIHDASGGEGSPIDAIRIAVDALVTGVPPILITIDSRHPYPIKELGHPDWLITSISREDAVSPGSGWRDVISAAPPQTRVALLTYGTASNVPHSVIQQVDLAGWQGSPSDARIHAVARRILHDDPMWGGDDVEGDAVRRGALIHVGDGTTMLNPSLLVKIDDIELSVVTTKILQRNDINLLGDLMQFTEAELLRFPDLGRKRLVEIKLALAARRLTLGATIPGWPPDHSVPASSVDDPGATLARTGQVSSGEMFRTVVNTLAIDPSAGGASDREVGATPISVQLQESIRLKLNTLSPIAVRLGNQTGWHGLAPLCDSIRPLLDRPGVNIPEVLGALYGAALEMGSFMEMDDAARADDRSTVEPLDVAARRSLQDVVVSMAPWLRRFPTIRELDDEAGRFVVAQAASGVARDAVAAAAEAELIRSGDSARLHGLLDAGERGGFVSHKAGRRGILSARNLVLAAAGLIVGGMWDAAVSEFATHSILARRAGAMLVRAEKAVIDIASELPPDVRAALGTAITEAKITMGGPASVATRPDPSLASNPAAGLPAAD